MNVLEELGRKTPEGTFTGLYGTKGVRALIPFVSDIYAKKDLQVTPVDVGFDLTFDPMRYWGYADSDVQVSSNNILSMLRLRAALRDEIQQIWSDVLGIRFRGSEKLFPNKKGTIHPEYLAALRERDGYNHIDTFIYPVSTKAGTFPVVTTWRTPTVIKPWVDLAGDISFSE